MIEWLARDASAGTSAGAMLVQFNGDAGLNYDYQLASGSGGSASASELFATNGIRVGSAPNGGALFEAFGSGVIHIVRYAGTTHTKQTVSIGGAKWANTTGQMGVITSNGHWRNDAAITSVTLLAAGGSLVAGSMATLYGVPQ